MYIETDRMLIRDFTMDDLNDMHDILGDDETMTNCEPAYTIEKTAEFLQKFCIDKKGAVAAVHKDTNKVIGYILFNEYDAEVYEIGWIFNKNYWRQGFAFESCKAVIDYAFNNMNIHKVFAEAIDGIKSVNLMKKLGMKLEGIQRSQSKDNFGNWADLYFYGILAEDRGQNQFLLTIPRQTCRGDHSYYALLRRAFDHFLKKIVKTGHSVTRCSQSSYIIVSNLTN